MALRNPVPNHNHAAEYQVSGIPFVTGSTDGELASETVSIKVEFPSVTRWIVVQCTGSAGAKGEAALKFGFTDNGVTTAASGSALKFFTVADGQKTGRMELKCKEIFLAKSGDTNAGFQVIAGLTGVERKFFPTLTGSVESELNPLMSGVG